MSYLADLKQVYDKHCIVEPHDVFIIYIHFLNTHVQVLAPRVGTFSDGLHEPLWAMNNGDVGHSLRDLGEFVMFYVKREPINRANWNINFAYIS